MNESQKHSKVEMEIMAHEKEMLREAMIRKLHDAPLAERIEFVIADYKKDHSGDETTDQPKKDLTDEEIIEQLKSMGLAENISDQQITEALKSVRKQ